MADLTIPIILNDAEQATLQRLVTEQNVRRPASDSLTLVQFLRGYITETWLGLEARRYDDTQRLSMRDKYGKATPEERLQIDTILNRYP